jgi:hypothetical protein
MTHTQIAKVQPHTSDDHGEHVDEQINDLYQALEQAEAAIDKLRESSKSKTTQAVPVLLSNSAD